ncbi:MAG: FAD-dependent oxidoreductase [Pseudomonadota bacterium]
MSDESSMNDESSIVKAAQESVVASDPYAREPQTFPVLTDEQVERVSGYGTVEELPAGHRVFKRGQRSVDFFLLLEGTIEIFDLDPNGEPVVITVHGKHQFTGELDLFNRRKILVGGRTGQPSKVARLTRTEFQRMASTEQDIGEIIMRAFILRRTAFILHGEAGVYVLGPANDRDVIRIQRFLSRNGYPVRQTEPDSPAGKQLAEEFTAEADGLPLVITADRRSYHNPSTRQLADELGLTESLDEGHVYDLAIIGGGPAGLSACVYGASEALDTIVIESEAPGGQAGTSSRIENYLGFPTGITGRALAARAWIQGQKFGAHFAVPYEVKGVHRTGDGFEIDTNCIKKIHARAVIVATGATYRKLALEHYERFEGQGIHYAATPLEAQFCAGTEVIVVGGGNSAGQAAVFLSRHARHVHLLVRGESLAASMSDYLVSRIRESKTITLHTRTQLTALHGERQLRQATWHNADSGESETRDISNIFVMIGAVPNTDWLKGCVDLDEKGFVVTGTEGRSRFQTSETGIFAVGDARSGSTKRVASGVGEGSVCISEVHGYLAER